MVLCRKEISYLKMSQKEREQLQLELGEMKSGEERREEQLRRLDTQHTQISEINENLSSQLIQIRTIYHLHENDDLIYHLQLRKDTEDQVMVYLYLIYT